LKLEIFNHSASSAELVIKETLAATKTVAKLPAPDLSATTSKAVTEGK
jgi:hypothetical protein